MDNRKHVMTWKLLDNKLSGLEKDVSDRENINLERKTIQRGRRKKFLEWCALALGCRYGENLEIPTADICYSGRKKNICFCDDFQKKVSVPPECLD